MSFSSSKQRTGMTMEISVGDKFLYVKLIDLRKSQCIYDIYNQKSRLKTERWKKG